MTKIDNDKLLKDFFAENKREIADDGFTRRVMHHLPDRSDRLIQIWTAFVMILSIILFIALDGVEAMRETLKEVVFGMINQGGVNIDPISFIIAAIVLLFFGTRKVCSLA